MMNERREVSELDVENLALLRNNIDKFMVNIARNFSRSDTVLLDVAPQDHKGADYYFSDDIQIETLDINPDSKCTHIVDLCKCSDVLGYNRYDYVVCTEVLEHTRQPFDAVKNIFNILKPAGLVFVSTPFNLRIHGPLPDCWRFTEHGLRELFKDFEIIDLDVLESRDRFLMPIQYTLVARKPF